MRGAAGRRDGGRRSFWWAILAVVMLLLAVGALYGAVMYQPPQLQLQVCEAKLHGGPVLYDPLTLNATLQAMHINVTLCWK